MKNKEIVERLKDSLDYEFNLSFNDRKELLSYIEQLEDNRDKYLQQENQQLKKQKNDVVEYIKHKKSIKENYMIYGDVGTELLRMLGEIDELD